LAGSLAPSSPHNPFALNMCLGDGVYLYGSYHIIAAFALSVRITIVVPTLEFFFDHQQPRYMPRPRDVLHILQFLHIQSLVRFVWIYDPEHGQERFLI